MSKKLTNGKPAPSLEELARRRFAPADKASRVARARQALEQAVPIELTSEQWKWVAEDPEAEDQV